MKRIICSLVCSCLVLSLLFGATVITNAEDEMNNKGVIYVNDIKIENVDMISSNNNEIYMPLRAVLESLGASVIWEETTGYIFFDYKSIRYVCQFVSLNSNFPEEKNILISRIENKDSKNNSDYIQLNPMSGSGAYCIINDRTYLYQETGKRLFEALECKVEINSNEQIVKIYNK